MKLLVPVDYSDHSRAVLAYAVSLFPTATFVVAHAWETQPKFAARVNVTTPEGRTCTVGELIREEAEGAMKEFLASVLFPAGIEHSLCFLSGSAADAIVAEAGRGRFDMIVMGAQSHSTLGRLLLGSVTNRVLYASPIPVLAVPMKRT
jgi:nucleotide-binding universal stress UspA family protein